MHGPLQASAHAGVRFQATMPGSSGRYSYKESRFGAKFSSNMTAIPNLPRSLQQGQSTKPRNSSLDGLRGIAVMLTYLVHYCGSYLVSFRGANPNVVTLAGWPDSFDKVLYWLFRSHHGVYIFFMLSGYLIAKVLLDQNFSYFQFLRNRLVRIYPAFLLALGTCIALGFAVGLPLPSWREFGFNLLFLNGFPPAHVTGIVFNNVTWSLFYEMAFYLVFPVVLMSARYFRLPILVTIVLAGILISYGPGFFGFYSEFFLFLFAGAVAGALPIARIKATADSLHDAIVVSLYCLVTGLMTAGYLTASQFVWLFACLGFLLIAKAVTGKGILARGLAWGPLVGLGRISYSFYLLHSISIALVFKLWAQLSVSRFGLEVNALYLGLLGFVGAVVLGWASFMIAERFYFKRKRVMKRHDLDADTAALDIQKQQTEAG
jgi:exopolysaccharide production protein ExoZ